MRTLLCLGFGYSAQHFVGNFAAGFDRVIGTTRTPVEPTMAGGRKVDAIVFDGHAASTELLAALAQASALLVSIPPDEAGDPVLTSLADALPPARLETIVYLSTVGVYGDHGGAMVDETTKPRPTSRRSLGRLAAERGWQDLGRRMQMPVAILRLGGIYGPGQNALVNLATGKARRIVKPGQVFNRIHVVDIGQAIAAALAGRADGIFNVTDDEPAPPQDVITYAAALAGITPPAEVAFAEAAKTMTAMARSFYGENRRVRNDKLKSALGVALRYPTYRDGIRALYDAGEFRTPSASAG
jgi:nucleoside-diphosphate-sugar epimerase